MNQEDKEKLSRLFGAWVVVAFILGAISGAWVVSLKCF